MIWRASVLCDGAASGEALRLDEPISFWGGVCPSTAKIIQPGHSQKDMRLTGRIAIIPEVVGSSSSSAVMLELLHKGIAPAGLIMGQRDAILPVGVLAAGQMGWPVIPVFHIQSPAFASGDNLELKAGGTIMRHAKA